MERIACAWLGLFAMTAELSADEGKHIINLNTEAGKKSDLFYLIGPSRNGPRGPRTPARAILGPKDTPDRISYTFEVLVDKSKVVKCPYRTNGYIKSKIVKAGASIELKPPANTATGDKGGLESPKWPPDEAVGGVNVADLHSSSDAARTGYFDNPGLERPRPNQAPAEYHGQFLVEVADCNEKKVECVTFSLDIEIDKDGKIAKSGPPSNPNRTSCR